jgi:hypothetical protein
VFIFFLFFFQKPGKYSFVELAYGNEQEEASAKPVRDSTSTLHQEVQRVVTMIFDVAAIKRALSEMEIDTGKVMSLGSRIMRA